MPTRGPGWASPDGVAGARAERRRLEESPVGASCAGIIGAGTDSHLSVGRVAGFYDHRGVGGSGFVGSNSDIGQTTFANLVLPSISTVGRSGACVAPGDRHVVAKPL